MIQGMIFDIDGTLLDSMPIWYDLGERYLRSLDIMPQSDLGCTLNSMTLEEGIMYLRSQYDLKQSPSQIRHDLKGIMDVFYRREVQTKPGVKAFLRTCHGRNIPMVLVTVGDAELAQAALMRNGIWQYFAGLLTCEAFHTNKHAPCIYQHLSEGGGITRHRSIPDARVRRPFLCCQSGKGCRFHRRSHSGRCGAEGLADDGTACRHCYPGFYRRPFSAEP